MTTFWKITEQELHGPGQNITVSLVQGPRDAVQVLRMLTTLAVREGLFCLMCGSLCMTAQIGLYAWLRESRGVAIAVIVICVFAFSPWFSFFKDDEATVTKDVSSTAS